MDPVISSIAIDAPREPIFDFLQDIANHPAFTDHYLVDWHLTRERSSGNGAGARFRMRAPGARFAWGDLSFVEVQRPSKIVEEGRMGKSNRIETIGVYELQPGPGGSTHLSYSFQSKPVMLSDRIAENFGGRWWVKRMQRRALRRLRDLVESGTIAGVAGADAGAGAAGQDARGGALPRITVAGL